MSKWIEVSRADDLGSRWPLGDLDPGEVRPDLHATFGALRLEEDWQSPIHPRDDIIQWISKLQSSGGSFDDPHIDVGMGQFESYWGASSLRVLGAPVPNAKALEDYVETSLSVEWDTGLDIQEAVDVYFAEEILRSSGLVHGRVYKSIVGRAREYYSGLVRCHRSSNELEIHASILIARIMDVVPYPLDGAAERCFWGDVLDRLGADAMLPVMRYVLARHIAANPDLFDDTDFLSLVNESRRDACDEEIARDFDFEDWWLVSDIVTEGGCAQRVRAELARRRVRGGWMSRILMNDDPEQTLGGFVVLRSQGVVNLESEELARYFITVLSDVDGRRYSQQERVGAVLGLKVLRDEVTANSVGIMSEAARRTVQYVTDERQTIPSMSAARLLVDACEMSDCNFEAEETRTAIEDLVTRLWASRFGNEIAVGTEVEYVQRRSGIRLLPTSSIINLIRPLVVSSSGVAQGPGREESIDATYRVACDAGLDEEVGLRWPEIVAYVESMRAEYGYRAEATHDANGDDNVDNSTLATTAHALLLLRECAMPAEPKLALPIGLRLENDA